MRSVILTPYGHYVDAELHLEGLTRKLATTHDHEDRELMGDLLIAGMASLKDSNINHFNEWLLKH